MVTIASEVRVVIRLESIPFTNYRWHQQEPGSFGDYHWGAWEYILFIFILIIHSTFCLSSVLILLYYFLNNLKASYWPKFNHIWLDWQCRSSPQNICKTDKRKAVWSHQKKTERSLKLWHLQSGEFVTWATKWKLVCWLQWEVNAHWIYSWPCSMSNTKFKKRES